MSSAGKLPGGPETLETQLLEFKKISASLTEVINKIDARLAAEGISTEASTVVTDSAEKDADVFLLIDRSGSMSSCLSDAQGGYDTFIKEQKKAVGKRYVSLWQFDTSHDLVYAPTLAADIRDNSYFIHPRGGTALLDAIVRLVAYADQKRDPSRQTIVVILTDGEENASKEATSATVKTLIESKQGQGWVFIYLGANQDAIIVANNYGIPMSTAATYDMAHVATTSAGAANMMSVGLRGGNYSFTPEQRTSFVGGQDVNVMGRVLNIPDKMVASRLLHYDFDEKEPLIKY